VEKRRKSNLLGGKFYERAIGHSTQLWFLFRAIARGGRRLVLSAKVARHSERRKRSVSADIRRIMALLLGILFVFGQNSIAQDGIALVATGSSMPEPLYLVWGEEFHKMQPKVQLRYLAEGTAESAARILAGTGDFGGGEAPISDKQLAG